MSVEHGVSRTSCHRCVPHLIITDLEHGTKPLTTKILTQYFKSVIWYKTGENHLTKFLRIRLCLCLQTEAELMIAASCCPLLALSCHHVICS